MKKLLAIILAFALALSLCVSSCAAEGAKPLKILCTTFPQYDWTRQVLGDNLSGVELTLMMDNGVDLHSYQPTVADFAKLAACDLFIYVGGESDEWVEDALEATNNPNLRAIPLLACVEAKQEEMVEGMQESEHDHDHEEEHEHEAGEEHDHEDEHDHEAEADEHVWLSLRNAQTLTQVIADALSELDAANAAQYQANAADYQARLAELDARYQAVVDAAAHDTVLFADRFPFRYMVDDYGLNYYAAFVGCSAETEASFETIVFLAGKVDELGLNAVLALEGAKHAIADTVVAATKTGNQRVVTINSLQSVTAQDVAQGASYLGLMEENLAALEAALN